MQVFLPILNFMVEHNDADIVKIKMILKNNQ